MGEDARDRGVAAAQRGDRQAAYAALTEAVQSNPQDEPAWLWLSTVVDDPSRKRECLARVLAINPQNEQAMLGMQQLMAPPVYQPPPPQPIYVAASYPMPQAQGGAGNTVLIGLVLGAVLLVACVFLGRLGGSEAGQTPSGPANTIGRTEGQHTVVYEVSGTSHSGDVTIQNGSDGTEQYDISIPWSKTFTMKSGSFVYLSVQNGGVGKITCTIRVDGVVYKTSTSEGQYKIASCSGAI